MNSVAVGSTTADYTYNALGELVKRTGGAPGTVHYVYDEAGHLLGEYNSSGTLIQETIWLGDTPVATLRPGTAIEIYYVHTDHLNTPRKVTRPSDNAARWTWESDPFGIAMPDENPVSLGTFAYNLRFPGQIYDAHTGLMYNYFRDYDAVTGRYVQSDPIGLAGGINTYGYVAGNPIGNTDPSGLFISPVHRELTRAATGREDLAKKVADVDFLPGSQDPWLAHWHAMRPPWKTPQEAGELYEWYLEHSLSQCTDDGLARALHAAQDSASAGHAGKQIWDGGRTFLHLPSIQHVIKDTWPTQAEWEDALQKTEDILRRYEERCSCQK